MSASDDHIVLFRRAPAELDRRGLERFARTLRGAVAGGAAFTCLIAGDTELRRLNREFLGNDYPTDVLSFPAGQGGGADHRFLWSAALKGRQTTGKRSSVPLLARQLGEIAISAARARAQAAAFGHSLESEIRILMLHGLLHLLGMDHATDRGQMQRAEIRWRERLSLPAGLIERARL